jgi:hypothetical protein
MFVRFIIFLCATVSVNTSFFVSVGMIWKREKYIDNFGCGILFLPNLTFFLDIPGKEKSSIINIVSSQIAYLSVVA